MSRRLVLSPDSASGRGDARRLLADARDRPGEALPHGASRAHAGGGADRHSGARTRSRRAGPERRLQRGNARRRAAQSFRRLPLSRAGTAEQVARPGVADDRRPAAHPNPALCPHPLLAGDAGGPGRRSRPARRRQRPPRRAPSSRLWPADGARRAAAGGDLRAPGGGLFVDLRPDRTDQFRLRRNGRGRRLRGGDRRFGDGRLAARPPPDRGLRACRRGRGGLGLRCGAHSFYSAAPRPWPAGAGRNGGAGALPARAFAPGAGRPELDEPAAQSAVRARARRRFRDRRHADGVPVERGRARRRARPGHHLSLFPHRAANGAPMPTIRSPPR